MRFQDAMLVARGGGVLTFCFFGQLATTKETEKYLEGTSTQRVVVGVTASEGRNQVISRMILGEFF